MGHLVVYNENRKTKKERMSAMLGVLLGFLFVQMMLRDEPEEKPAEQTARPDPVPVVPPLAVRPDKAG